ncbi:hypothetical protein SEA_OTTERSTEDTS21_71 [Gordonia phage OtterstedtS21]|uniref:Uncharacterized protein n=3 Tax=Lambovirus TaxID=2843412 RepID=A0A9E7U2U3_9CAUD|nr:hypothetical protein SEA_PARVUSTARDA_70 [Gordonia phage ParvusTarda]UVT31232.1 hypothetical protein SEA_OTTERSTEDTS21_71 [Gordonia phage OtterstedtS21]WNM66009.1 hypothetical protein SEA_BIRTHDAYBOY_73 [Gordonia phage BirthdayBoy]
MAPSKRLVDELINRSSGKTHWAKDDEGSPLCGNSMWGSLSGTIDDPDYINCVTCKTCLRMIKKRKEEKND